MKYDDIGRGSEIVNADLCPSIETKYCKLKQLAFFKHVTNFVSTSTFNNLII